MSGTAVIHFLETVVLAPLAHALFGAAIGGVLVKSANPGDPAAKVRNETPTIILQQVVINDPENTRAPHTLASDDVWWIVGGCCMLLVLVSFLYAHYAAAIWSSLAFGGEISAGLALPTFWVALANRNNGRRAVAWLALTCASLALGIFTSAFAPSFTLAQTPKWILRAASAVPAISGAAILNLPGAFDFVRTLPNPAADVLWLFLQALGVMALILALGLQVARILATLIYGAAHRPPKLLRKLTTSSAGTHYAVVCLLVALFYLCASDKLYAALHTGNLQYMWHYWPV